MGGIKENILTLTIIVIILFFAAILRIHTFYLPHNHGDQVLFLGLAMKLERFGIKGYNLRGIDLLGNEDVLAIAVSKDREKGALLESLERDNVFYYSQERISNIPPAFAFLIMMSHNIFTQNSLFLTVNKNLGPFALILRPAAFFDIQFYAVWINFIFSLLFILATFLLGKIIFNEKAGLWASLLLTIAPVDILTSQRLWADEMVSFFIALCVLLFWQGKKKNNLTFIALSGISAGIAAVAKQSGIFIIFIIVLCDMLIAYSKDRAISYRIIFNKELFVFILFAVCVCGFWYTRITLAYGVPWHMSYQKGIEEASAWFIMLSHRSRYGQLYYFVYLVPIFAFFYLESAVTLIRRIFTPERILCLVWFFSFALFLLLIRAKEERYMLPAYPAIAILSGLSIENLRIRLNKVRYLGDTTIILVFFLASAWSINLGLRCVFSNCPIFNLH